MKKRMAKAADSGAAFAIIIGEDELDRDEAAVKDLRSGEQRNLPLERIAEAVRRT